MQAVQYGFNLWSLQSKILEVFLFFVFLPVKQIEIDRQAQGAGCAKRSHDPSGWPLGGFHCSDCPGGCATLVAEVAVRSKFCLCPCLFLPCGAQYDYSFTNSSFSVREGFWYPESMRNQSLGRTRSFYRRLPSKIQPAFCRAGDVQFKTSRTDPVKFV